MMYVCPTCLMAIESHEGYQHSKRITVDEVPSERIKEVDYFELMTCDWCDEEFEISEMREI